MTSLGFKLYKFKYKNTTPEYVVGKLYVMYLCMYVCMCVCVRVYVCMYLDVFHPVYNYHNNLYTKLPSKQHFIEDVIYCGDMFRFLLNEPSSGHIHS
jgi:hypothetical protein